MDRAGDPAATRPAAAQLLGEVEAGRRTGLVALVVVVAALVAIVAWQKFAAPGPGPVGATPGAPPPVSSSTSPFSTSPSSTSPSSTPTSTATSSTASAAPSVNLARLAALRRVTWAHVALPLDCAGLGIAVDSTSYGVLPGGPPAAVVAAHCDAGAGSPPSVVAVMTDAATSGAARPVALATLVHAQEDLLVQHVTLRGPDVLATGYGYSVPTIPRCCPDVLLHRTWRWSGGHFARVSG